MAFDDEDAAYARKVIATDQAIVPTPFWFEIRNVLLMDQPTPSNTVNQTRASLTDDLSLLPFEIG